MRIYLLRHGQSQWQVSDTTDLDSSLTELGRKQSHLLANRLYQYGLHRDLVFSSPLKRAQESVAFLSKDMKTRVRILTDLQEAPFKVASYLPQAEHPLYKPAFPELSHEYTLFKAQVRRAFTQLVHVSEEHRRVIAMTHGGVIKTILRLILGNDSICFEINNASLTLLEWRDGIWRLLLLNCQEHLPEDLRCSSVHKKILGFHNG